MNLSTQPYWAADGRKALVYALFIGEDELKNDQYKLKNLASGDERAPPLEQIIERLKSA